MDTTELSKFSDGRYLKGSLSILQEFYLEFFGTLIPGILAVTATILLGIGFYHCVTGDADTIRAFCEILWRSFGGIVVFLTISYMMGAIAYRRNPKIPDAVSAYSQWQTAESCQFKEASERLSVRFNKKSIRPQCICDWLRFIFNRAKWIFDHADENIDYPYPLMRRYLLCRGLSHLAAYVPWCTGAKDGLNGMCSKHYVNIIKQRIRNSGRANLIIDMVRNESHVRMLGSHWYILTYIQRLVVVAFMLAIAFFLVKFCVIGPNLVDTNVTGHSLYIYLIEMCKAVVNGVSVGETFTNDPTRIAILRYAWLFMSLILAFALVKYCRQIIELGFHYVRTREVVMILESAWMLDSVKPNGDSRREDGSNGSIFSSLIKEADKFKNLNCRQCEYYISCYKYCSKAKRHRRKRLGSFHKGGTGSPPVTP